MTRARRGFKARRRRNKVLKMAKGFTFDRRTKYRRAMETLRRGLTFAFVGRKQLKRDMRALWVVRISAAAKLLDTSYSRLMNGLKKKGCNLNRKMLSEIAATDFDGMKAIVEITKN